MAKKATKRRSKPAKKPPAKPPGFPPPEAADPPETAVEVITEEPEPVRIVDLTASRCPTCRSTNREPYHGTQVIKGPVRIGRTSYSRIELKRTICSDCGQRRIDRFKIPEEDSPEPGE